VRDERESGRNREKIKTVPNPEIEPLKAKHRTFTEDKSKIVYL